MVNAVKIFVSATSSDLMSLRGQVKAWILDMGWLPVVQDNFPPEDKTVATMLHKRISECDAVVHIIGECYGAEPRSVAAGEPRRSYTQLEAAIARKMRKRLFVVLLREGFPYDLHEPEAEELRALQRAYREQVANGEHLYIFCGTPSELEPAIRKLRVEVDKLRNSRRGMVTVFALLLGAFFLFAYYLKYTSDRRNEQREGQLTELIQMMKGNNGDADKTRMKILSGYEADIPGLKTLPTDKIAEALLEVIAESAIPTARADDLPENTKQIFAGVYKSEKDFRFSDAAKLLETALGKIDPRDIESKVELLAESGRVAKLQLLYRDAADFYQRAADASRTDHNAKWRYTVEAAGALYAQGNEAGENAALKDAIQRYQDAADMISRDHEPREWGIVHNDLGKALAKLGERENGTQHLTEAVGAFQEALKVREKALGEQTTIAGRAESPEEEWADTEDNLGYALVRIGERESEPTQYQAAVDAFTQALSVRTPEANPLKWALTQNNLGNALIRIGEDESGTEHLVRAIAAYTAARDVRSRKGPKLDWAATENNLCLATDLLGERESGTQHLEEAVAACNAALTERTQQRVPLEWAMTQNNLGNALLRLAERETGTAHLRAAIDAFNAALAERREDRVPLEWAETKNNLGLALQTLSPRENEAENLQLAISTYNEALRQYRRDSAPLEWAMTKSNIGNALIDLGERETGTARLQEAVASFDEALLVYTRERAPLNWAAGIGDQGVAKMLLAKREANVALAKQAVEQLQAAYQAAHDGNDTVTSAIYQERLPEARGILDKLTKH